MASTAATSPAAVTDDHAPSCNDERSPFLKLAPEVRSRIYKYAFEAVEITTPVPHALTQINNQIRNDCRTMYYASIECIKIDLRTEAQYKSTKRWLAEEDWSMFPMLPGFTFSHCNHRLGGDTMVSFHTETIVPAEEFSLQIRPCE